MSTVANCERIAALEETQRPLAARLSGLGLLDAVLDEPVAGCVVAVCPSGELLVHRASPLPCKKLHPLPFRGDTVAELFADDDRYRQCDVCLETLLHAPGDALRALSPALELHDALSAADNDRIGSPRSILRHLTTLRSSRSRVAGVLHHLADAGHPVAEFARVQLEQADEVVLRLRERLVSPRVRASAEAVIRRALLGKGRERLPLHDHPVLVGITPPPDPRTTQQVVATLAAYEVFSADTHVVVAVPMFVYTWVSRTSLAGRKEWSSNLEAVVLPPGGAADRSRVAAQLWDPSSSGPLGTLHGAYLAAGGLEPAG